LTCRLGVHRRRSASLREIDEDAVRETLQIGARRIAIIGGTAPRSRTPCRTRGRLPPRPRRTESSLPDPAWPRPRARELRQNRTCADMSLSCCGRWALAVARRTSADTSFSITETSTFGRGRFFNSEAVNGLLRSAAVGRHLARCRRKCDQRIAAGRLDAGKTTAQGRAALWVARGRAAGFRPADCCGRHRGTPGSRRSSIPSGARFEVRSIVSDESRNSFSSWHLIDTR